MARIVPPGVNPNLGVSLEDPLDKIIKLVELGSKAVGGYQSTVKAHSSNISSSFDNLVSIIGDISDENSFSNIESQLDSLTTQAFNTGDEQLKLQANLTGSIISNARGNFNQFKDVFNNITSEYGPDGMFNKDNLTIDKITSWTAEELNEKYNQINMYKAQLFNPNGAPRFKNYKVGSENVYTVAQHVNNFEKQLTMGMDSLLGDGKITMEEAQFIITARKEDLEQHREDVLVQSTKLINTYTTQSSQAANAIAALQKNQETTLFKLSQESPGLSNILNSNPQLMKTYNDYAGATPSEMIADEDGKIVYADLIKGIQDSQTQYYTLKENEIARYNYWSPVPFHSDIIAEPMKGLGSKEYYDGEVSKEIADLWAGLSDKDIDYYSEEYNIKSIEDLQTHTGGESSKAPALLPLSDDDDDTDVDVNLYKTSYSKLSKDNKKAALSAYRKETGISVDTDAGQFSSQNEYYEFGKWYNSKMDEMKDTEEPFNIDTLLGGLSDSLQLTQKDKNYIQKNVKGMASRPFYNLLGIIRKYKSSTDNKEKEILKSQIEQSIK